MTTQILDIWILAASGIQLGTLWIMKLSILPMLNALPYNRYVNVCQLIDMHIFHPIAVWNGLVAAGIGILQAFLVGSASAAPFYIIGSAGMLIVGIASEGINRPIWRQIETWSPSSTPEQWNEKRYRWHLAHQVRTYGAILAVASYIAAMIVAAA
jgi:uncharacterized membrane protein